MIEIMEESSKPAPKDSKSKSSELILGSRKSKKSKKNSSTESTKSSTDDREVLLKLPGGFEYKAPGKRQRVIIASLVLSLNALLLVAVGLYFYVPSFKEFIYNIGRT